LLSRHKIDFRLSPIAQQSAAATPTIAAAILAVQCEPILNLLLHALKTDV
jgi:hypothetical protein